MSPQEAYTAWVEGRCTDQELVFAFSVGMEKLIAQVGQDKDAVKRLEEIAKKL